MNSDPILITGAVGRVENRRNIFEFVKDEMQFSLYVQALAVMQEKEHDDPESFFQLAAIHGAPYIPWQGAVGDQPFDPKKQWGGYCTHGSELFPTWHRPLLALFEQTLQRHAIEIASRYKVNPAGWMEQAKKIRQFWWDWAVDPLPPPELISLKQVTITNSDGNRVTVDNPLYCYKFHNIDASFPYPFNGWPTTLRHPTSNQPDATDDLDCLEFALRVRQPIIRRKIHYLFNRVHTWQSFSNHTQQQNTNNLERIHDSIHVAIGGRGHMSYPAVAAYDVAFLCHHSELDRKVEFWRAINDPIWVSPGTLEDGGTFTFPEGLQIDSTTPLTPFWKDKTTFWNSNSVRDTRILGYSYPEFDGLDIKDPPAVRKAILGVVNRLYGPSVFEDPAKFTNAVSANDSMPNHGIFDWTVRMEFRKFELDCSFTIVLFFGSFPEDPKHWLTSENLAGVIDVFVNGDTHCANCRSRRCLVQYGFEHLSHAIVQRHNFKPDSLKPEVADPYLRNKLRWRVLKADGQPAHMKSLRASFVGTPLSYPTGEISPVPGTPRPRVYLNRGPILGRLQAFLSLLLNSKEIAKPCSGR